MVFTIEEHVIWGQCLPLDRALKEHDYCRAQIDPDSLRVGDSFIKELSRLQRKVKELEDENGKLHSNCLLLEDVKTHDKQFQFWTGFPNYESFKALYDYLDSIALGKKRNWRGAEMVFKNGETAKKDCNHAVVGRRILYGSCAP